MPSVNPNIVRWARETAGFSPEQAASALGLKNTKTRRAVERLAALEEGHEQPSRSLLNSMAQKYRRPLVTFYLETPPKAGDRGEDFRNVPDRLKESESLVDALVRDVRARQATVRDLLLDDGESVGFVNSMNMEQGVDAVLASIKRTINLEVAEYRAARSPESAFALLRSHVESAGIYVLLIGNLGSYHTAISVEAFRGFALADDVAPFVVINDQDAVTAWSFTLLHEVAHLWLGKTGVSGRYSDLKIEKFCNDVAATFLFPSSELDAVGVTADLPTERIVELIDEFASARHLSRTMVAYRLYRASKISEADWRTLSAWFLAQWSKARDAKREKQKEGTGPDYYVVRRHRLGNALLTLVARNVQEGLLTPTRASKVLGVKPRSVAPLLGLISSGVEAA